MRSVRLTGLNPTKWGLFYLRGEVFLTTVAGRFFAAAIETAGIFRLAGELATGLFELAVLADLLCARMNDFTAG